MSQNITIFIRVLPGNEKLEVNLPLNATASDVIETLLDRELISNHNEKGQHVKHKLLKEYSSQEINEFETMENANIKDKDILLLAPIVEKAGDTTKDHNVNSTITIDIRHVETGDEFEIELPLNATPSDIIEGLLNANIGLQEFDDEGNRIIYDLKKQNTNYSIGEDETLWDAKINEHDILLLIPSIVAGGCDSFNSLKVLDFLKWLDDSFIENEINKSLINKFLSEKGINHTVSFILRTMPDGKYIDINTPYTDVPPKKRTAEIS